MNKVFCPTCNKKVSYKIEERLIEKYKSKIVNVYEKVAICNECHQDIYVPSIEQENFDTLYSKYREVADIISANEIIKFREKYGISQRELVAILGWGKMTINRYEKGSLPSKSHSDFLKLIINNDSVFEECVEKAYEENNVGIKTYTKIRKGMASNVEQLQEKLISTKLSHKESVYTGFAKFNLPKLENLIGYIADKVDNLYKTSLNKYLFYIDFLSYKENCIAITGLRYEKYQYGPIIESKGYEEIINMMTDKFEKEETYNNDSISTKIKSCKNYDLSYFKDYEIEIIDSIITQFKELSCNKISDLSHEEDAWKETKTSELISYDYAETLTI